MSRGWFVLELVSTEYEYVPPVEVVCEINNEVTFPVHLIGVNSTRLPVNEKNEFQTGVKERSDYDVFVNKRSEEKVVIKCIKN